MIKKLLSICLIVMLLPMPVFAAPGPAGQETVTRPDSAVAKTVALEDWKIASSSVDVTAALPTVPAGVTDSAVAAPGFDTDGWAAAKAPESVLGSLVNGGYYDAVFNANAPPPKSSDAELVFYADNFSKIPFKDFYQPWWYSTNVTVSDTELSKRATLTFKGISYVGEIYVNGNKLSNENITIKDGDYLLNSHYAGPGHTAAVPNILKYDTPAALNPAPSSISPTVINDTDFEQYKKDFKGTFRTYELDVTPYLVAGANNIKVKVTRPVYNSRNQGDDQGVGDLSYYWVDWDPQPADNNMGLTGEVTLAFTENVRLSNPAVASKVSEALDAATLAFYVDVNNVSAAETPLTAKISAVVKDKQGAEVASFAKGNIIVQPDAYCQEVVFDPVTINVAEEDLWWPYLSGPDPYGKRSLYTVEYAVEYLNGDGVQVASDYLKHRFGIREVTTEVNISDILANNTTGTIAGNAASLMHQIYVNHRPVLGKGAGYCPTDLLLRRSDEKNQAVIDYVKYMGMNVVRDEGKFFDNKLLDLFDENGIMNFPGWCCCDRFQGFSRWSPVERFILLETQYAQVRNARAHASFISWYNGSDRSPSAGSTANEISMEIKMLEVLANLRWPSMGSIVGAASSGRSNVTGVSGGQRMGLGYDYQTPNFFYAPRTDTTKMAGFISEGGGGPTIPIEETIRKMVPEEHLWPLNTESNYNAWAYFSVRQDFLRMDPFITLLEHTYGGSDSLTEFTAKAQIATYDMQRAQYESLGLRRFTSASGFINWMLCQGWPTMMWNQFDYYLNPNGATFGAAKGNEALHIMYDTYNYDAYVINNTQLEYSGYTATAVLYDLYGNKISDELTKKLDTVAADGVSEPVAYNANSPIASQFIGYEKDASGELQKYRYNYFGSIKEAYGVNKLWGEADFKGALTAPTTGVYFLFMELKDPDGNVVSYNSYALPMKRDVSSNSRAWSRTPNYQAADMTPLSELPAIPLDATGLSIDATAVGTAGDKTTFSVKVTNNSPNIAYGIDVKAYKDFDEKALCAPVIYSDNLFSMKPGETRMIDITVDTADWSDASAIAINCFNNIVGIENPHNVSADSMTAAPRREVPLRTSRNLALASAGATATASSGNANNLITVSGTNNTFANGLIDCYLDTDMTSVWANTAQDAAAPWVIVNLGKATTFDRLVLRTYFTNSGGGELQILPLTPGRIVLEAATGSDPSTADWTEIYDSGADYQVTSVATDIVFDESLTYQLIRIKPSQQRRVTPAYGAVQWSASNIDAPYYGARFVGSGPAQVNAVTQMRLASFEVYAFKNSVFLDIPGDGVVTADTNSYAKNTLANDRVIALDPGADLTLTFAPKPGRPFDVLRDGVNITAQLTADNELVLEDVTADTVISFYSAAVSADYLQADYTAKGVVKNKDAMLIVAAYDAAGKLLGVQTEISGVAADEWRTISVDAGELLEDLDYKTVNVFLWDSGTFAPLADALTVN